MISDAANVIFTYNYAYKFMEVVKFNSVPWYVKFMTLTGYKNVFMFYSHCNTSFIWCDVFRCLQVSLLFPDDGLIYNYRLDDAGISLPAQEEDEEEEIKKRKVHHIVDTYVL